MNITIKITTVEELRVALRHLNALGGIDAAHTTELTEWCQALSGSKDGTRQELINRVKKEL